MIEETEKEEAQEQPKQVTIKEAVRTLLNALEIAKSATGIRVSQRVQSRTTTILLKDGSGVNNETLAHYIERAEIEFLKQHGDAMLELARDLVADEIGSIRELLKCT
jgi:hypothetical protein